MKRAGWATDAIIDQCGGGAGIDGTIIRNYRYERLYPTKIINKLVLIRKNSSYMKNQGAPKGVGYLHVPAASGAIVAFGEIEMIIGFLTADGGACFVGSGAVFWPYPGGHGVHRRFFTSRPHQDRGSRMGWPCHAVLGPFTAARNLLPVTQPEPRRFPWR